VTSDRRVGLTVMSLMRLSRRSAVVQFAVSGLLATLVIGLIAVTILRHIGTQEAIRDAKQVARLAGEGIVAPNITAGVLAGTPGGLRRLDRTVRERVLRDGIVRVKLWSADGRVIYSDEPRLIGTRYPLAGDDLVALRGSRTEAEVSDLGRPENRYERSEGKLLEVYLPVRGPDGQPLLFEAYQRFSSVSASGRRLWLAFAPALFGGLLLLQLINLPLARSLARRLRKGQEERETLLRRALDASQTERRTIAADLHDGVVQDLVGVSFTLAARAEQLNGGDRAAKTALREGAARTRDSIRALRTLLVDIYPPSLHTAGLLAALGDVASTYTGRGLLTTLDLPAELRLGEPAERLLFRCAQELLRNAQQHGGAERATIAIREIGDRAVMDVRDDGRGFDPAVLADRPQEGHFGMRMLADLVESSGGRLDVESAPGQGTAVRVEVAR
jgi:two-component system NarL family sensor kinase